MRIIFFVKLFLVSSLFFFSSQSFAQLVLDQRNYDVKFYHLDISLTDNSTYIKGKTLSQVVILSSNDTLIFDLGNQLKVSEVLVDSEASEFIHANEKLHIISNRFIEDESIAIEIFYEGDGDDQNHHGALFNKKHTSYGSFTYSLTEPYSSKYWYPCKQVLEDKVDSVFVYITVPNYLKAGSNGILQSIHTIDDYTVQYRWESYYPTAYYLISVAVGNYLDYTIKANLGDSSTSFPIVNYIYNSEEYLNKERQNIDTTAYLLNLYSELFWPYPFSNEKYGHCIVPIGGGMEHQTMTSLGNFGYDLVAHELAHQWFGNWVTCASWNDIWINEGFASYLEYLAHEYSGDIEGANSWMDYAQERARGSIVGSVYVPDEELDDVGRIFDHSSTYKKGASIIHMLRHEINNDSLFFGALKQFLSHHSYSVASVNDLLMVLKDYTGNSYTWFFEQWYYGSGYPVFDIEWFQQEDTLYVKNIQTTTEPQITPFFRMQQDFKLIYPTGDTIICGNIESPISLVKIKIDQPIYDVQIDPQHFNLQRIERILRIDSLMSNNLQNVLLFPNPSSDKVTFFSRNFYAPVDICFYDLSGNIIKYIKDVNPNRTEIPIADLDEGMYMVTCISGNKRALIKFLKT